MEITELTSNTEYTIQWRLPQMTEQPELKVYLCNMDKQTLVSLYKEALPFTETGYLSDDSPIRELALNYFGKDTIFEMLLVCSDIYRECCGRFIDFDNV